MCLRIECDLVAAKTVQIDDNMNMTEVLLAFMRFGRLRR